MTIVIDAVAVGGQPPRVARGNPGPKAATALNVRPQRPAKAAIRLTTSVSTTDTISIHFHGKNTRTRGASPRGCARS